MEEHKQLIYKVCYIYSTDADNLNDLYQEVVINLWKAFPRFRGECKASTWIYRIGLNTCISFFRKSRSKPEVVPITVDLESFDNSHHAFSLWCLAIAESKPAPQGRLSSRWVTTNNCFGRAIQKVGL